MSTTKPPAILFDIGHNEELTLNAPELTQLVKLLKVNGLAPSNGKVAQLVEKLSRFKVVVLGNPLDSSFTPEEISALISFVESGGGLLLVSGATIFGKGGDAARNTNLNEISNHFQFEFSTKALGPSTESPEELITAVPAGNHPILAGVGQLLFTSGVSLRAENTETHLFRVNNITGTPTISIATEFQKGRIVAFGGGTFFFNNYLRMGDHEHLVIQLFRWLSGEPMNLPVKKFSSSPIVMDETSAAEAIADLRQQLNKIEEELSSLKEVINTSIKEMEKIVRQVQDEEKEA